MNYKGLLAGIKKYGSNENDICVHGLGITPEQVQEHVVVAPWWEPTSLPGLGTAEYLSESDYSAIKIWNIISDEAKITYIKTGIGAPVLMDALLTLGVTQCKQILFVGSVGSLDENIGIGDIVIPEYSICGDGASRYLANKTLKINDVFGKKIFPDSNLLDTIVNVTDKICLDNKVEWHRGKAFSIDTIFAQFAHIDEIMSMGCNVIEMETAAAFLASKVIDVPIAAILSVSDNTVINKSLISGRLRQEMDYRKYVRRELFPRIILETFRN